MLGLAIRLRILAEASDELADTELFLSAALALENRANHVAFGAPGPPVRRKIDLIC